MRRFLIGSLLLNGALGLWLWSARSVTQTRSFVVPAAENATPRHQTATTSSADTPRERTLPARWEAIESSDYLKYMENLRNAGCPEDVIGHLIALDILKNFQKRIAEILKWQPLSYWQKRPNWRPTAAEIAQIEALQEEQKSIMESLVGVSPQTITGLISLQPDRRSTELAWLTPEKRDAAQQAFAKANLSELEQKIQPPGAKWEAIERANQERRIELLKNVLSIEELEEYQIRTSREGKRLRGQIAYMDLTKEEFKGLWKHSEPDRYLSPKKLRDVLGEKRAEEFQQKTDRTYRAVRQIAERYGLPENVADDVSRLKRDGDLMWKQIGDDSARSEAERRQQWAAYLAASTEKAHQLLGANAMKLLENRHIWLPEKVLGDP